MSLDNVQLVALNFECKGISHILHFPNVCPQDNAFDCAHIAYDCNDRAIQTAENKKSRLSTLLRQEPGLMFYSETILIKVKSFNFDSFNVIQGRSAGLKSHNFQDSLTIC